MTLDLPTIQPSFEEMQITKGSFTLSLTLRVRLAFMAAETRAR